MKKAPAFRRRLRRRQNFRPPPNPISVGGKMADFGDGGGQAPYAPPPNVRPWGAKPKNFRGAFGAAKIALHTLVFTFYCFFKNKFSKKGQF